MSAGAPTFQKKTCQGDGGSWAWRTLERTPTGTLAGCRPAVSQSSTTAAPSRRGTVEQAPSMLVTKQTAAQRETTSAKADLWILASWEQTVAWTLTSAQVVNRTNCPLTKQRNQETKKMKGSRSSYAVAKTSKIAQYWKENTWTWAPTAQQSHSIRVQWKLQKSTSLPWIKEAIRVFTANSSSSSGLGALVWVGRTALQKHSYMEPFWTRHLPKRQ